MSALGVKRTLVRHLSMSVYDPKRTSVPSCWVACVRQALRGGNSAEPKNGFDDPIDYAMVEEDLSLRRDRFRRETDAILSRSDP